MKTIDINTWKRKNTFNRFSNYDNPLLSVSFPVRIDNILEYCTQNSCSFTATFSWVVLKAMNSIEEFKYRVKDGEIVLFDKIGFSMSVLNDELINFTEYIEYSEYQTFLFKYKLMKIRAENSWDLSYYHGNDVVYFSNVPTIPFFSVQSPVINNESIFIPQIFFSKYYDLNGSKLTNVSLRVHHGFIDGSHIGKLVEKIESYSNEIFSIL
jgi:chloramphenicol O-acetyltransferase type A